MNAKYARPEYERRWRVEVLPDLGACVDAARIEDRYFPDTRLRLRRVTPLRGGESVCKLGQKVRPDPNDPRLVMHTTLYLAEGEYEWLNRLPGRDLRKVRYKLAHEGEAFSLDVFEGRHAGLSLLEIETSAEETSLAPPPFAIREVTGDPWYTGGWLAFASDEELALAIK